MRNIEAVFFTRYSFLDRVRGKALQVPYVPANSGKSWSAGNFSKSGNGLFSVLGYYGPLFFDLDHTRAWSRKKSIQGDHATSKIRVRNSVDVEAPKAIWYDISP